MNTLQMLSDAVIRAIQALWAREADPATLTFSETKKEFEGDYTLVTFPLTKLGLGKPEEIGERIGAWLVAHQPEIAAFNVIKGFLNLSLTDAYWHAWLMGLQPGSFLRNADGAGKRVVLEFSSPNTNKPLHLGHCRNNFLGYATGAILEANGYDVIRVCLVNDRGIAICKSMLMYQKYGAGATPESTGMKPDHFVVKYYVMFDQENETQYAPVLAANPGMDKDKARTGTPLYQEAQEMLRQWEAGDAAVMALWQQMNAWVYAGFDQTYRRMGIRFDKTYYESDTYKLGNELVDLGLQKGVFFTRPDGAVAIDLTADGLDTKVLRRSDGTSIYITQDIGTAVERHKEWNFDQGMYVVADEQDYHFKVLFLILQKLGYAWAHDLHHVSYGMVDLTTGRMKTRTGTVVDADELMQETVDAAAQVTAEFGKTEGMAEAEKAELHEQIAMAALKYFILKVQPRKRMIFNPEESVQLQGDTGPFIQYSYARTRALARKAGEEASETAAQAYAQLDPAEKTLLRTLSRYPDSLRLAAQNLDPSEIATLLYEIAKDFNRFYDHCPILKTEVPGARDFRLHLSRRVSETLAAGLDLLGIQVPERM